MFLLPCDVRERTRVGSRDLEFHCSDGVGACVRREGAAGEEECVAPSAWGTGFGFFGVEGWRAIIGGAELGVAFGDVHFDKS